MALWLQTEQEIFVKCNAKQGKFLVKNWEDEKWNPKYDEYDKISWTLNKISTRTYEYEEEEKVSISFHMVDWEDEYNVQFWVNWVSIWILNALQSWVGKMDETLFLTLVKSGKFCNAYTALTKPNKEHSLWWASDMKEFRAKFDTNEWAIAEVERINELLFAWKEPVKATPKKTEKKIEKKTEEVEVEAEDLPF